VSRDYSNARIVVYQVRVAGYGFEVITDHRLSPGVVRILNEDGTGIEYNAITGKFTTLEALEG
jgi:hypothetical protein